MFISCSHDQMQDHLGREQIVALEMEVQLALEKFSTAYANADVTVLDSMIAEEYLHTNTNGGMVSREQWLNWNRSRAASLANEETKIFDYRNEDVKIKILSAEIALVSGINAFARERDGTRENVRIRYSHVWVKNEGVWQRQLFHDSRINIE